MERFSIISVMLIIEESGFTNRKARSVCRYLQQVRGRKRARLCRGYLRMFTQPARNVNVLRSDKTYIVAMECHSLDFQSCVGEAEAVLPTNLQSSYSPRSGST